LQAYAKAIVAPFAVSVLVRILVNSGITIVKRASWPRAMRDRFLGSADDEAPFFGISRFSRSPAVENALAARGLAVFSTDVDADDWFCRV
jgi:hypothetical protein